MKKGIYLKYSLKIIVVLFFFSIIFNNSEAVQNTKSEKENVIAFYNAAFNQKNFEVAAKYLGSHYTQHNPHVANGPEGLKIFIFKIKNKYPNARVEIKRVFVDGNYVTLLVHSIMQPNTLGQAVIDIFKLDHGKIVEHWGVSQDIPEKSANLNGMF